MWQPSLWFKSMRFNKCLVNKKSSNTKDTGLKVLNLLDLNGAQVLFYEMRFPAKDAMKRGRGSPPESITLCLLGIRFYVFTTFLDQLAQWGQWQTKMVKMVSFNNTQCVLLKEMWCLKETSHTRQRCTWASTATNTHNNVVQTDKRKCVCVCLCVRGWVYIYINISL